MAKCIDQTCLKFVRKSKNNNILKNQVYSIILLDALDLES